MHDFARVAPTLYAKQLHKYLLCRLKNPREVNDLAQDVWLRLVREKDDQKCIDRPLAYLYGVASHILADHYIESDARRKCITTDSELADDAADGTGVYLEDDKEERLNLQQQIDRAIAQLPPTHAAVLLAHKRDGLSYEECAEKLGLSVFTIEKYLTQAKARLRLLAWER